MPVKLLRRILAVLIVTAYVGATMQVAPTTAVNAGMIRTAMDGMMHEQNNPGGKMPCKGMLPGCITDLGCIFLLSLPAPDQPLVTVTAWWSSVTYPGSSALLRGRTIKPALGPPISLV